MVAGERNSMQCEPPVAVPVARPAAFVSLERRVDEALATARASEAAIMTVGAAAFDAAEQARRAAELAERASAAMVAERIGRAGRGSPGHTSAALLPPEPAAGEIKVSAVPSATAQTPTATACMPAVAAQVPIAAPEPSHSGFGDERLHAFNLRADRLASRLRAIA